MSRILWIVFVLFIAWSGAQAQLRPGEVQIARDSFGVPHIYGKTNAATVYGLAWAHAEDDFTSIQHNLLSARGYLGRALGKDGVLFDYAVQFLEIDEFVEKHFDQDISPEFLEILKAFCQGLNEYAALHPKEVLVPKALPFTPKDVITGYTVNLSLLGGVGMALKAINDDLIDELYAPNNRGSNSIALAPSRTEDSATWLLINSHQPLEGPFAWYEAHLVSDEGLNIAGGLFPGCVSIMLGSNQHLAWAHTTNYNQWGDIYTLSINPKNKHEYYYDGEWIPFREKRIKLHVKLGPFVLGIKRTLQFCEYGPVFKTKQGSFALRFPSPQNISGAEAWYRMNLATNWQQFESAVKTEGITSFNILYADQTGNIFYQSNGAYPLRNPALNWNNPIAGVSSDYKWTELIPYEDKPAIFNPECGYVFNANNTPLQASDSACNWSGYFPGLQLFTYNRGERLNSALAAHPGRWKWEQFLTLKFDKHYHPDGQFRDRFEIFFDLKAEEHPKLSDAITTYQQWNMDASVNNSSASLPVATHYFLNRQTKTPFAFLMIQEEKVQLDAAVEALSDARRFLLKHHGRLDPSLGEMQQYIRGAESFPAGGTFEVLRAADPALYKGKKGMFRIKSGDGYMQIVRFHPNRPVEIHSINAYGSSAHSDSPHFSDQMSLFAKEQFRTMTLDWDFWVERAEVQYHPGEITYR